MADLRERLEREILPLVERPSRYVGAERNVPARDVGEDALTFLLAFPDVYEIGMSHLGLRVLYDILNRRDDVRCERCFAPWTDMEALLRERGLPLFSIESHRAASEFDVIGFTLQYELHYTTILSMIELAGLPLRAVDRVDGMPLVIAGGPNAFNPEPMAEFFDAILVGDGESAVLDMADVLLAARAAGETRARVLERLAGIPGVYVPSLYRVEAGESGGARVRPVSAAAPERVVRRSETALDGLGLPACPIVPITEAAHDRLTLEIMRGCTRGCRFCQAGMITRPVRERPVDDLVELAVAGIDRSGYDEVSLMSLSTSDYGRLDELVAELNERLADRKVSIALPSLRLDRFSLELAGGVKGVRRAGLTFAPEAGSQRMRDVINKNETEEHILETVEIAFASGWDRIKLYFMIGLPTETDEDIEAIAKLVSKVRYVARGKRKGARLNVSISPFVPKPHTPFQWEAQDLPAETARKESILRERLRVKGVKLSLRDPNVSFLEGVLARGGRRLAEVVRGAYERGARLEAWTEHFDIRLWQDAFDAAGLDPNAYLAERAISAPLPWDHIDAGPSREFLLDEREKAVRGEVTPDCRLAGCFDCGACGTEDTSRELPARTPDASVATDGNVRRARGFGRRNRRVRPDAADGRWRVRFEKRGRLRFLSHLDIARAITRASTASGLPVAFSQGFNPHPKLSFGPPLPVGTTGESELFDIELTRGVPAEEVVDGLSAFLPDGLDITEATQVTGRVSIAAEAIASKYTATLPPSFEQLMNEEIEGRLDEVRRVRDATVTRGDRTKTVRPADGILELALAGDEAGEGGEGASGRHLTMTLKLGVEGAVRPVDLLTLLVGDDREALLVHVHHVELLRRRRDGSAGLEPF